MEKSPDAFRTISEAAEELDLPQHVLRFWETRFATIKPLKRGGGRRHYRPEDVLLLKGIRHLLYDQGFTIKGVQKILKDQGARYVAAVGNGGIMPALPPPGDDDIETDDSFVEPGIETSSDRLEPPANLGASFSLNETDRQRLQTVLHDLLECKRLLERARE